MTAGLSEYDSFVPSGLLSQANAFRRFAIMALADAFLMPPVCQFR